MQIEQYLPDNYEEIRMRLLTALLALLAAAAPAFAQEHGETRRYFKDWLAACRADDYCSATAYMNPNPAGVPVADYILRIGRHAEETYWEISFTTVAQMADPAAPFVVSIDDAAEEFAGAEEVAAYGAINDFFLLGPKAQAVMDRLAPGATATIAFTSENGGAETAEFSLAGLTAALIWIDEQQGRLGSERVAEAPPVGLDRSGSAPPAGDVPPALMAQRAADTECQPMADLVNGAEIEIDPALTDSAKLYILPCWGAAYNFAWKAYVEYVEGEYATVALPEFTPATGWTATTHLVNYSYDPETKTITTFNKGRGLGDCGTAGTWRWHEFGFRLIEFAAKDDCDGLEGEFPVVYRLEEGGM